MSLNQLNKIYFIEKYKCKSDLNESMNLLISMEIIYEHINKTFKSELVIKIKLSKMK